uniref:Cytosol aminopeptidase n=1 Tax=Culicoides sonorensis TaxID=179676 RepID=A0A336LS38_CULSO
MEETQCRLCLNFIECNVKISDKIEEQFIYTIINEIADISVALNDPYPQNICSSCFCKLTEVVSFKDEIKKANEILHSNDAQYVIEVKVEELENESQENFNQEIHNESPEKTVKNISRRGRKRKIKMFEEYLTDDFHTEEPEFKEITPDDEEIKCEEDQEESNEVGSDASDVKSKSKKSRVRNRSKKGSQQNKTEIPIRCCICWTDFKNEIELDGHVKENHQNHELPDKKYTLKHRFECKYCHQKFLKKLNLDKHFEIPDYVEPPRKRYDKPKKKDIDNSAVCTVCGKLYYDKYDLQLHELRMHSTDRPIACPHPGCPKRFAAKKLMNKHLKYHGERKHVCEICGKGFVDKNDLKNHKYRHMDVKPLKCHLCPRTFTHKPVLETHILSHTGQNIFACEQCDKTYKWKEDLRKHYMAEHLGIYPYKCKYCGKGYTGSSNRTYHEKRCGTKMLYQSENGDSIVIEQDYDEHQTIIISSTGPIILGLYETSPKSDSVTFTTHGEAFDKRLEGKLSELVRQSGLYGKLGDSRVFNGIDNEFGSICVVGLGEEGVGYSELEDLDEGMENARVASGIGARMLRNEGCSTIQIDPMEYPEQVAEGSSLAVWRYQDNKSPKDRIHIPKLELFDCADHAEWTQGLFKADAQNFARTLTDAPSNQLTPQAFAQTALDILCPCGIEVNAHNLDWIESHKMGSFLAVAKSSCEQPMFLEISYCGDEKDVKPILISGTGITFNSGGLCLKECQDMSDYRGSMAGAAIVLAVIRAAATLSLPINIVGVIPLCENMPSGMAFKPGDVLTTVDGKTIGVHDPNNVHRLCLSDALKHGQKVFRPRMVINVASATKEIRQGLGGGATACFTNSYDIWKQIRKAGVITGDRVWQLPLWQYFTHNVKSYTNFDISNKGHGFGQPCLAAAFVKEFCSIDFLHMDINGVAKLKRGTGLPYLENGRMTGRPTRTLIQFLHQMACAEEAAREIQ